MPGALHTSCTVEMVSMQRRVDVAVLDEIQMIGDDSRWVGGVVVLGGREGEGDGELGIRGSTIDRLAEPDENGFLAWLPAWGAGGGRGRVP